MDRFLSMNLWSKFRLAELDQVMRQDDKIFVNMLNKIRVSEMDQNVEDVIKLRFIDKNHPCDPGNILNMFAEKLQLKDTETIN